MVAKTRVQSPVYIKKRLAYNTANIATGVPIGTLPAGSMLRSVLVYTVDNAFDGSGTVTLEIGDTEGDNSIISGSVINLKDATAKCVLPGGGAGISLFYLDAERTIWARVVDENEDSSEGQVIVIVEFIQDN